MNNGSSSTRRVELLFEFHSAREFTSLTLHLARRAKEDIGLTEAIVNLALESGNYLGKSVRFTSQPEQQQQQQPGVYNVTIDLKKRVGRFVQLQMDFTDQWLLLSEVSFESGTCTPTRVNRSFRLCNVTVNSRQPRRTET